LMARPKGRSPPPQSWTTPLTTALCDSPPHAATFSAKNTTPAPRPTVRPMRAITILVGIGSRTITSDTTGGNPQHHKHVRVSKQATRRVEHQTRPDSARLMPRHQAWVPLPASLCCHSVPLRALAISCPLRRKRNCGAVASPWSLGSRRDRAGGWRTRSRDTAQASSPVARDCACGVSPAD